MNKLNINPPRNVREKWDRILALIAILSIVVAWVVGFFLQAKEAPDCLLVLPDATECRTNGSIYEGVIVNDDNTETVVGWATISSAQGYAGPVEVLVGVNPAGELLGVSVIDQTETPSFFNRVLDADYLNQFEGMQANSAFKLGEDLDGVTNATFTSRAISDSVREASYMIAESKTSLAVTREAKPITFGLPEIVLIALYALGFVAHRGGFRYKTVVRWGMLITGMVVLGFVYNQPFTLAHINSLLLGFWPDWHTNLYWFLLVGGILFVVTVDNKNPYCQWFCPFGAAQECLGAVGGAKVFSPGKYRYLLKNVQRLLAWSAILLGLLFRNPALTSYEIFGALFSFNAATLQWAVLIVVLLMSLFVRRPWCEFLCPIDPVVDLIHAIRRWLKETWQVWKRKQTSETAQ